MLRIGIVVGEMSGDALAASLIQSLIRHYPKLQFEGILGPNLLKLGGQSLYPMELLSVMGLVEPLARLPSILKARRHLIQYFVKNPPDIFIGVDAPDFNLSLENTLRKKGIKTVHYVSPSVWAWRQGRIHLIKKAVDLMLTLFPFEAKFYQDHQIPVCFTGHPFADQIPLEINTDQAKKALGLESNRPVVLLLPGSRNGELKYLAETFLQTARLLCLKRPDLQFILPLISDAHRAKFEVLKAKIAPEIPIQIQIGHARKMMEAADVVLVTSGTATLEVMLHKKPMVVVYKMHPITYQIAKRIVKVPYISLPNLLAGEKLVPEFIQAEAKPELLAAAILDAIDKENSQLIQTFTKLQLSLKKDASETAAQAVLALLKLKLNN